MSSVHAELFIAYRQQMEPKKLPYTSEAIGTWGGIEEGKRRRLL